MKSFLPQTFSLDSSSGKIFTEFSFFYDGIFRADFPRCIITLRAAGSMRYKNENPNRNRVFAAIGLSPQKIAPLVLTHSKTVFCLDLPQDSLGKEGDGLITVNPEIIPSVTVADCMPVYLYEPHTGCFGVLHSGWKGTGIVAEALKLAEKNYGAKAQNFSVLLGPHIQSCCYDIDEARAAYFTREFTPDCVTEHEGKNGAGHRRCLSLAAANLFVLERCGVSAANIAVCSDCTCCSPYLGSFRRETGHLDASVPLEKRFEFFTPMAACLIRC